MYIFIAYGGNIYEIPIIWYDSASTGSDMKYG